MYIFCLRGEQGARSNQAGTLLKDIIIYIISFKRVPA